MSLPREAWDRLGTLRQTQDLAVLAAFFYLLFFAAAKKSRCRPAQGRRLNSKHRHADASEKANAQGRRLKHEGKTRMPVKTLANQTKN